MVDWLPFALSQLSVAGGQPIPEVPSPPHSTQGKGASHNTGDQTSLRLLACTPQPCSAATLRPGPSLLALY